MIACLRWIVCQKQRHDCVRLNCIFRFLFCWVAFVLNCCLFLRKVILQDEQIVATILFWFVSQFIYIFWLNFKRFGLYLLLWYARGWAYIEKVDLPKGNIVYKSVVVNLFDISLRSTTLISRFKRCFSWWTLGGVSCRVWSLSQGERPLLEVLLVSITTISIYSILLVVKLLITVVDNV